MKANEYCLKAVEFYTHFLRIYAPVDKLPKPFTEDCLMHLEGGVGAVDKDEMVGFLTGHFNIARLLSKVQGDTGDHERNKVKVVGNLARSLERFAFVAKLHGNLSAEQLEEGAFEQQLDICGQMVKLLPTKIDRVKYRGENFGGNVA